VVIHFQDTSIIKNKQLQSNRPPKSKPCLGSNQNQYGPVASFTMVSSIWFVCVALVAHSALIQRRRTAKEPQETRQQIWARKNFGPSKKQKNIFPQKNNFSNMFLFVAIKLKSTQAVQSRSFAGVGSLDRLKHCGQHGEFKFFESWLRTHESGTPPGSVR
jgi:hypothetical protein